MEEMSHFIEALKDVKIIDKEYCVEVWTQDEQDYNKPLYAVISKRNKQVTYYMDKLYHNGIDNEIIDMEQFMRLQIVVNQLTK